MSAVIDSFQLLNPKYALAILRHGGQVITAINCFKISHYIAVFFQLAPSQRNLMDKARKFKTPLPSLPRASFSWDIPDYWLV
ncbi:hypothetical protein SYJ56_03195 [Algoriphagus sp. D3-2-R+10]|uniref:hypothetical protein n=1 Tax=Algoriphagus aurantiacus TaxID=3103948 RepID=UPI002B3E6892|nr:hypothetical protein [Algoriphagus sp. D3-2-R+10]MEB2774293.1 hypothetical protein [Algoriphagus sp. D3-2-R+10]